LELIREARIHQYRYLLLSTGQSFKLEMHRVFERQREMKMRIGSTFAFCLAAGLALAAGPASAQQFYNNWNTAACGFTDHARFRLHEPTRLTSIELWYHWGPRESEVRYEIFADGEFVKRGRLMRAGCDPYQEAWCEARANVGADLPRGDVEIRTERAKLCQNDGSDGNGFIHAFGMPTD